MYVRITSITRIRKRSFAKLGAIEVLEDRSSNCWQIADNILSDWIESRCGYTYCSAQVDPAFHPPMDGK